MARTPGTPLGPYEIVAPLGASGMSEVRRWRDTKLGRDVALKIPLTVSRAILSASRGSRAKPRCCVSFHEGEVRRIGESVSRRIDTRIVTSTNRDLRERVDARRFGSRATLSAATMAALARYDWPGNVRELQNVLAALAVRSPKRGIVPPAAFRRSSPTAAAASRGGSKRRGGRSRRSASSARRSCGGAVIVRAPPRSSGARDRG